MKWTTIQPSVQVWQKSFERWGLTLMILKRWESMGDGVQYAVLSIRTELHRRRRTLLLEASSVTPVESEATRGH
jgi:hypothetical protein